MKALPHAAPAPRIDGLQGRPELNGPQARLAWWDADKGRWHVEVAHEWSSGVKSMDVETVALKPTNLLVVTTGASEGGGAAGGLALRAPPQRLVECRPPLPRPPCP